MDDNWIESRVAAARREATDAGHDVPDAASDCIKDALHKQLQEPMKPQALRDLVKLLAAATKTDQ